MKIRILKTELVDWRNIEPLQPANFKHIYNYKHIERSILENGFVNPFFVWENQGVIYSIDGVTRKEILSNLENVPDLLPAVFIDAKNRQDAVKILLSVFNTKENPIDLEVLTEWINIEQVEVEVQSLNVVDINDIEEEAQEILEAEEDEFDLTQPETPETVLGDLYEIGEHRLLCGDSTDSDSVAKLMNGQKADMVFTDPPYGMNLDADFSKMGSDTIKAGRKHENIENDDKQFDPSIIFTFFNYCNDIVLFGADYYSDYIPNKNEGSWLIWDKRVEDKYDKIIGSAFETIFSKRKVKREIIRYEYVSWANRMADKVNGIKPHPTMKPIGMLNILLDKFKGNFIVDLFLGSGSTMAASHQLKRKCYGM